MPGFGAAEATSAPAHRVQSLPFSNTCRDMSMGTLTASLCMTNHPVSDQPKTTEADSQEKLRLVLQRICLLTQLHRNGIAWSGNNSQTKFYVSRQGHWLLLAARESCARSQASQPCAQLFALQGFAAWSLYVPLQCCCSNIQRPAGRRTHSLHVLETQQCLSSATFTCQRAQP